MVSNEKDRKPPKPKKAAERDTAYGRVGRALRTVYQETIDESVPDEFLDLLNKLD